MLIQLNGQQLDDLLKLLAKQGVNEFETFKSVPKIIENENKYILEKAYKFLIKIQTDDEFIMERLKVYENPLVGLMGLKSD